MSDPPPTGGTDPTPGAPRRLAFAVLPDTVASGMAIKPITVDIVDTTGAILANANDTVFVSLAQNPGHATLVGDTFAIAVHGVATLGNLRIDMAGVGYTLRATSHGMTAAISESMTVVSWGPTPESVTTTQRFSSLSRNGGGTLHCGITSAASTWCWGRLTNTDSAVTSPMLLAMSFSAVSTATMHACGLTSTGEAWCWGENGDGQLGNGTMVASASPVKVAGGQLFTQIATGMNHTCALTPAGQAYCWGMRPLDPVGNTTPDSNATTPVAVNTALRFQSITAGVMHTCALTADSTAYCWGAPGTGSVGLGTDPVVGIARGTGTPKPVLGNLKFTSLAAGGNQTCGLVAGGGAYCWGSNHAGQIGNGPPSGSDVTTPTGVLGVPAFTEIRTGGDTDAGYSGWACALTASGTVWCWGATHNPNGIPADASAGPAALTGGPFTALSVGSNSACALAQNGAAWCWGLNDEGQLGRGH